MPLDRLTIVCQSKESSNELRCSTRHCPGITVHCGDFGTAPEFDAIATAGNSFGLMDAGIDLSILKFFGPHLQESIQQRSRGADARRLRALPEPAATHQPVHGPGAAETGSLWRTMGLPASTADPVGIITAAGARPCSKDNSPAHLPSRRTTAGNTVPSRSRRRRSPGNSFHRAGKPPGPTASAGRAP